MDRIRRRISYQNGAQVDDISSDGDEIPTEHTNTILGAPKKYIPGKTMDGKAMTLANVAKKQDSPIKSNADRFADYIEMRQAANDLKIMEAAEAKRRLVKQGLSEKAADQAITEARKNNKDPMRIKASEVKDTQGSLLKTYARRSAMSVGCLQLFIVFICALPFFLIIVLTATAVSDPLSILDDECGRRALVNKDDGANCVRDKYLNNNGTSFGNQGLTI